MSRSIAGPAITGKWTSGGAGLSRSTRMWGRGDERGGH